MRRKLQVVASALAVLASGGAFAEGSGVLEVEPVKERLECPKEQPALLIAAAHDGKMRLELVAGDDPADVRRFEADLKAGVKHRQAWKQARPEVSWLAKMHVDYADGKTWDGVMEFTFSCSAPISVRLEPGGLDLAKGRLDLRVTGPAARAEAEVLDADEAVLLRKELPVERKRVRVRWPADERGFGGVSLKVFDRHGAWVRLELVPFSVEIPHEEVEFESGRWEVRPSEAPKLQETLERITEELEKFPGDLSAPILYIAGYTDTVGSKADNGKLSDRRAASIGRWFKTHGFAHDVWTQGFGEDVLAAEAADETPEPANRRAVYVLSNVPPPVDGGMPRARWRRLR